MLQCVAIPFSRGFSQPRGQTGSPALQADSLPSEPPGNPLIIDIYMNMDIYVYIYMCVYIYSYRYR